MAVIKSQQKAVNKYIRNNYDRLNICVPKGQKAAIESAANALGESVNTFTQKAILARMGLEEWPTVAEQDHQADA